MNVLALDQGTSVTKALVVCPERGVLAAAEVPLRPDYLPGGGVEVDPAALLESVVQAGRWALERADEPIGAVGLANQGETVLAWDRATGKPLTPAIVWQDRRSSGVCARLAGHADELTHASGLPLDPYFAAPKMTWLRENLSREGVVTTSDAWLVHALTGEFVTDASTASRTMLLDLDTTQWSPLACRTFDLADEQPAVVDCAGVVGETRAFGPTVPLSGLAVDQQAALFAQGCLDEGSAKCTYGTGAFLLANVGNQARRSRAGLSTSVAWRLDGAATYCLDGQVYTVGTAIRWLMDLKLITEPTDVDRLAGAVDDSGGVEFVPGLAGLGAPYWRASAAGAFLGLRLASSREHLVRAVVEGIAAQVTDLAVAAARDLGTPLTSLRVDGGVTRSRVLMQAQADLLQVPVEVYPSPHATGLGVAAFALLGVGAIQRPEKAIPPWQPAATFEPRRDAGWAAERMERFRAAVGAALRMEDR